MSEPAQQHEPTTLPVDIESQQEPPFPKLQRYTSPSSYSLHETEGSEPVRRRPKRSNTAQSYPRARSGKAVKWNPGEEPGLDPTLPEIRPYRVLGELPETTVHQRCEITVVDFSRDVMRMYHLDNDTLESFLNREREPWVVCRWINVNGLSWDVVRLLANHKKLHRLAIEDLMHTANRTKVDWYSDQAFVVLAMQKLIQLPSDEGEGSEKDSVSEDEPSSQEKSTSVPSVKSRDQSTTKRRKKHGAIVSAILELLTPARQKKRPRLISSEMSEGRDYSPSAYLGSGEPLTQGRSPRTLQRFQGGPNEDRIDFMERYASLAPKGLGVTIEQVSMFLHADNTVTSFFESSADDIESPIVRRLSTPGTILRQCCDASLLIQAILDAIIDLSLPVTSAYQDAIGDLELAVLTDPDIKQSSSLYILTSEITTLRNAVQPIIGVINSLRDHRSEARPTVATRTGSSNSFAVPEISVGNQRASASVDEGIHMISSVTISAMCQTYLGDVLDQCITTTEVYDQMRRAADNMIDLIFNTLGANQNESMKQLTLVTCIFLPPTFLTGYFGMNFNMGAEEHTDALFWTIAVPVGVVITLILMRDMIQRNLLKIAQKQLIKRSRQRRKPQ